MKTIAIVGVGLIGGSFGLAMREAGFSGDVIGVSSRDSLRAGLAVGAITRAANLAEAAADADLIYLAQPVDAILTTIPQLKESLRPGVLVTDAGSTKQAIVEQARRWLPDVHFLGGHPLAGKEQRGVKAAEAGLFAGRPYVLTPNRESSAASQEFEEWLGRAGARVVQMEAEAHDAAVAFTSHVPQLVSTALAVALSRQRNPDLLEIFGPGLRDMTRLAGSSAELWDPILRTNQKAVGVALKAFREAIEDLQGALESDRLVELFEAGSTWASQLRDTKAEK